MTADPRAAARQFRSALGAFATGVTIVTTRSAAGEDIGMTANSFNSVSLDPPMVLWSLSKKALSLQAFLQSGHFAVHVLSAAQDNLSHVFATSGADKFAGLSIERGIGEVPLLDGCSARFQCRTAFQYEGGDHVILVGRVESFDAFDRPPLVFQGGRYAVAVEKRAALSADRRDADSEPASSFSRDFLFYLLERAHHQLFLGLRRDLERHGLSEAEWFVLSILGVQENSTVAGLDRLLAYTGRRVTYDLVARLAAAGLVRLKGGYDPHVEVHLTDSGRKAVIETVAAAKAMEAHAGRNLDPDEIQLLKTGLRSIIRDTDPGTPTLMPPPVPDEM
jgi:3-hydroxy-9,10-secoandrosta-1,3,5(10)-triene-9,17-dione monooxygenase reductase component